MDEAEIKITETDCSGRHLEDGLNLDDDQSARRSTFKHFEETMDQFQQCKVEMATKSLQAAHKYLLDLDPDSLGNPTNYEKEQVKRGTEMCFSRFSASPLLGAVLSSPEPIADNDGHFHAIFTTVFGAVALKLHNYNMAIDIFQRCTSLSTCDVTPRTKNNTEVTDISVGLAKANIGSVYLITKMIDKAKDYLKCALEIFETYKNQSKNVSVEINIVATQTNLSLVYQYQKDYPAAVKLQDSLLAKAKDLNLPHHLAAAIHYNRVELLLELKEPVKALKELRTLDSLSEKADKGGGIFAKFISSKICLAYQMAGEVALAREIAERLTISFRSPKSLSPPLSPSSKSFSSASGSASSSPSSSSSSLSSSPSSLISSFSFFFPDFKASLDGSGDWDLLFAVILNFTDFYLNERSGEFLSFLDVFVPTCQETLVKNHPTLASLLYRQGVRFSLMKRNLSSKKCFEEALSILISFDFGSDHLDLMQCNIALAKLLLLEDFQGVLPLKSCPDQNWREFNFNLADGDVSSDIPSRTNVSNIWDNNEELELLQMSGQGNFKGKHGDCLKNGSQKDKNRGMSTSQKTLQTPNAVSDASCQRGIVIADSGEGPDALTTNGACGFDKGWSSPARQGDSNESNLKTKRSLGLKGGRRNYFPSQHSTQRDRSEDDFESIHIGIHPSFLARHSDEFWDSCGPFNDLEVPSGIHSGYHRSEYVPERNYLAPPGSSTFFKRPDLTKCYVGDHSAYNSAMGSPPQPNISPDGYQPQESSLNLVLMPKTVPVKTLKPPPSSSLFNDGFKTNLPLTVTEFPTGDVQARIPPAGRPTSSSQFERAKDALGILPDGQSAVAGLGLLNGNSNTSADESLAALERRVAEACSLVERTLKERQEREKALKETEQKRKEERAKKEQQASEIKEREAKETREREHRNETVEGNATSDGGETPSQDSAVAEGRQWLCEHYQRLCRVKFPCCGKFFPCHRCHNNSGCANDNSKAREAYYVECSVCSHQQEITQDAHTCARCRTRFSAYFCSVCKHFTGEDKAPYHCKKCGICRIYKDRSFHCDVCNVCLDKRLEGRHSCRENSGHDECCICLEDAFSGCQILPCSHKVHRECAIAMIQNGVRSCPICRHPLYSPTSGNE